jgi:dolichol-phosphate mannosyltransferase
MCTSYFFDSEFIQNATLTLTVFENHCSVHSHFCLLTIIIPVFNEEECLAELEADLSHFLKISPIPVSILFVDDGSSDNSLKLIEQMHERDARFHYLSLSKNGGLSAALKAGIDHIQTPWIGYMDADLQTKSADFINLMQYMPDYDLITGFRQKRNDSFIKKITSKIANAIRNWVIQDNIIDTGCPLKIMKADIAKRIPLFKGMHRFLPALIMLYGGNIVQVPVAHYPRHAGIAKYHLFNRIINPFFDMLAFYWMKKRYIHYQIAKEA